MGESKGFVANEAIGTCGLLIVLVSGHGVETIEINSRASD